MRVVAVEGGTSQDHRAHPWYMERQRAITYLCETLNNYMNQATSSGEKYVHIVEKDKVGVVEKVVTVQKWLEDQTIRQLERLKKLEHRLHPHERADREEAVRGDDSVYFVTPIFTKPS